MLHFNTSGITSKETQHAYQRRPIATQRTNAHVNTFGALIRLEVAFRALFVWTVVGALVFPRVCALIWTHAFPLVCAHGATFFLALIAIPLAQGLE